MPRPRGRGALRPRAAACALLALAALLPAQASAQSAQANATTFVALLSPGTVTKLADIDFGTIAQPATAGTLVLSPQAAATCTPSGALIHTGTCRAAKFGVYGKRNWKLRLKDANGGPVTLTGPGGATMTMTNLTIGIQNMTAVSGGPPGWSLGSYNIDANTGMATFWLGGTLNVGAAQAPGVYNGVVLIQVQFN